MSVVIPTGIISSYDRGSTSISPSASLPFSSNALSSILNTPTPKPSAIPSTTAAIAASSESTTKIKRPSIASSSSSSYSPSIIATLESTSSPSDAQIQDSQPQSFQSIGGVAGLAGIVVAGALLLVIIIVAVIYFCCRGKKHDAGSKPRPESKRSTWQWGSRVGPWRLNVSGSPTPDDHSLPWERRATGTTVHKDFPEIVVLDARPSTDNSVASIPYVSQPSNSHPQPGQLQLTMPFVPPDDLLHSPASDKYEEDFPERYIPYVPPKQYKNSRSTSTVSSSQSRISASNQYGGGTQLSPLRHTGTNSVSAAVPSSQRTSMAIEPSSGYQLYQPYPSRQSNSQQPRASVMMPLPPPSLVIPPKGMQQSRYQSPCTSPRTGTVVEETESEIGDDYENEDGMDLSDERAQQDEVTTDVLDCYLGTGWNNQSPFYDGDSEVDPEGGAKTDTTRGRFHEHLRF